MKTLRLTLSQAALDHVVAALYQYVEAAMSDQDMSSELIYELENVRDAIEDVQEAE